MRTGVRFGAEKYDKGLVTEGEKDKRAQHGYTREIETKDDEGWREGKKSETGTGIKIETSRVRRVGDGKDDLCSNETMPRSWEGGVPDLLSSFVILQPSDGERAAHLAI